MKHFAVITVAFDLILIRKKNPLARKGPKTLATDYAIQFPSTLRKNEKKNSYLDLFLALDLATRTNLIKTCS